MQHLLKRSAALFLALILLSALSVPALATEVETAASVDTALSTAARTAAEASMTYGGADSIQWAVWDDGAITASGGTASPRDLSLGHLAGLSALFGDLYGIGSVSKIYTTVAVLQLVEEGKISLDAPVTRYLEDFTMADPRYRDITVRMLLDHSSGIMGTGLSNALLFDDADSSATDGLLEALSTQRLVADPGAYSVYCNDGFTLAELVVEAVTGQQFMDRVDAYILEPAGLDDTFAPGGTFSPGRLANIYTGTDPRPLPQDCLNAVGAGGLYATARDLAAFGGALTDDTLLSAASRSAMAAPEYSRGIWPDDTLDMLSYGLGWDAVEWFPFSQNGIQALVKGGDTLYYHAGLVVLPEYGLAAAVVSSGGASTYNELAATKMLIAALEGKGISVDETIPALPDASPAAMPAELTAASGWYGSTSLQYRVDVDADGTLTIRSLDAPQSVPAQTFTYCSDGTFRDATGTVSMSFVSEENGQVYLYQKAFGALPGLGTLPVSNYAAVKLPENTVSPEVQAAWDDILTMDFLPLTEKYTSQVYLALAGAASSEVPEQVPGYVGAARIVDAHTARYVPQLPGSGGRDGQDLFVYEEDGATYMTAGNTQYIDASSVQTLFTGSGWSWTTIQEDGHARWYHVGAAAGTTMHVTVPEGGGFYVYDSDGQVAASSVLWDDASAVLPEGGLVVFSGAPGVRFHLHFTD